MASGKILILSAPSGSGKTTLAGKVLATFPEFEFSVSATTRAPRGYEVDGQHYYFLSQPDFEEKIGTSQFLEWEEVYPGRYYGTLKSEIARIWAKGGFPVLDIDVEGGLRVKELYGDEAVAIFIQAPSLEALRQRLIGRGADSEADIQQRLDKAAQELTYAPRYDHIVVNDDLDRAAEELSLLIRQHFSLQSIGS